MSGEQEVQLTRSRRLRWARALARVLLMIIGAVQSLLGVMFAVALVFSTAQDFGEGVVSIAQTALLLPLVAFLFLVGVLTLVSAFEEWDPPHNRWQGIRWPTIALVGALISLLTWAAIVAFGLFP
jgi:hypothetical protein